jgi:hypothetical protein
MSESDLVVVFDLLDAGFKDWWFSASGLIFLGVGLILVCFPRIMMQLSNETARPRWFKFFSWLFLGFAIFWTTLSFITTYGHYLSLRDAYTAGNFEVVEGPVENYEPKPASSPNRESFTVAGQRFEYSDHTVTPGFNTTREYGGPIDAGVYVRISHVDAAIVRLEAERSAVEAAEERPARSKWPRMDKSPDFPKGSPAALMLRYSWVMIVLVILANAVIWRWRGRRHIARDPSLRQGYNRMVMGFVFWTGLPVLVGVLGSMFGDVDLLRPVPDFSNWSLLSVLYNLAWGAVIAKWVYWTFYQNGAAKLAKHPGLVDHEWVAKLGPSAAAAGYVITTALSLL